MRVHQPPSPTEAKAVMAALAQGERIALARLIGMYGPGIRRYARQALTVPSEAEDVAQEVFLRAWKHAERYDPSKGAVSSWLYRIAVNLCIDHNRRGGFRRFVGIDTMPEPEDDTPGAEAEYGARQRLAQTQVVIRTLPKRQQQALLLKAAGELTGAEIAMTLNTSEGAVEQLLVRARATLRARLELEE